MAAIRKGFEKTSDASEVQLRFAHSLEAVWTVYLPKRLPINPVAARRKTTAAPTGPRRRATRRSAPPNAVPYQERFSSAFHFRGIVPTV
jgi:hypothetical protein